MRCPLVQINLVTKDMASAVEFYQLLGWEFEVTPDGVHAAAAVSPDLLVELDTAEFASVWNSGAVAEPGGTVFVVAADDGAAVDALFYQFIDAGHRGVQAVRHILGCSLRRGSRSGWSSGRFDEPSGRGGPLLAASSGAS